VPPYRVVIVEDEPHIVLSLEFLLERAGYETAAAAEGAQGGCSVRTSSCSTS
jgi:CheY-like chemotaxis protein